jgi:hypothetical protein
MLIKISKLLKISLEDGLDECDAAAEILKCSMEKSPEITKGIIKGVSETSSAVKK